MEDESYRNTNKLSLVKAERKGEVAVTHIGMKERSQRRELIRNRNVRKAHWSIEEKHCSYKIETGIPLFRSNV